MAFRLVRTVSAILIALLFAGCEASTSVDEVEVASELADVIFTWSVPDQRANGENLQPTEITHYVVSYANQDGSVGGEMVVNFGASGSVVITELPPADYTFSVVAFDVMGLQSKPALLRITL